MSATHVVCYHGLGDALRYAFPLAASLADSGWNVFLHTRHCLLPCIGRQPALANIVSIEDEKLARIGDMARAAEMYADALGEAGLSVFLGSSEFDLRLEQEFARRGVPCWSRAGVFNGADSMIDAALAREWDSSPEYYNDLRKLCAIFGINPAPKEKIVLRPDPARRQHRFAGASRPLVGAHCLSSWPARNYPHGAELTRLLSDEYEVWNFDGTPCPSLAELAWIMADSAALLSVDTMPLHLARLMGVPVLNLQGPVWKNKEDAPFLIRESRTLPRPAPLGEIDRVRQGLAELPPEFVAAEFKDFIKASDRSRWAAE